MKGQIVSSKTLSQGPDQRGILIPEKNNLLIRVNVDKVQIFNIRKEYIGPVLGEVDIPDHLYEKLITLHQLQKELGGLDGEFSQFYKGALNSIPEPDF